MTTEVKDELSRLVVKSVSARRAEVTSLLRFAGGLHIVGGRVVVEAEVDLGNIARRLRKDIFDLYGYNAVVHVLAASGIRKGTRYVLRGTHDGEPIGGLLARMGAPDTRVVWEERRMRREVRATANRLANFDDANLRRSARAAVAAAARVERALEILGDTVPNHLAAAGKLRVEHRQASLEELGRLADPPMTKDAVAGRIRRLLSMADRKAKVEGIPDTESAVTPDLLEDA